MAFQGNHAIIKHPYFGRARVPLNTDVTPTTIRYVHAHEVANQGDLPTEIGTRVRNRVFTEFVYVREATGWLSLHNGRIYDPGRLTSVNYEVVPAG